MATAFTVWDGVSDDAGTAAVWDGVSELASSEVRRMSPGYSSVSAMLSEDFYIAHRGGSLDWPEMSLHAYTQSVYRGTVGALEVSIARTSDGVFFGLHDADLHRTSPEADTTPASSLTWVQVQGYTITAAGLTDPDQARQPYARLEDILAAYADSHVLFIDAKVIPSTYWDDLWDLVLSYTTTNRVVAKAYYGQVAWATDAAARGIQSWGYFYEANTESGSFATYAAHWDLLGLECTATSTAWTVALGQGKPVIAHGCATQANIDAAAALGASGFMVTGVRAMTAGRGQIVAVGGSSHYGGNTSGTPVELTPPTNLRDGVDYLLAFVFVSNQVAVASRGATPAGWTYLYGSSSPTGRSGWVYGKVYDSADTTYTFAAHTDWGTSRRLGMVLAARGVDRTSPIDAVATANPHLPASGTSMTVPGDLTTVAAGSLMVVVADANTAAPNTAAIASDPSGWTRPTPYVAGPVTDGSASASWMHMFVKTATAGGAQSGPSWSWPGTAASHKAWHFALRPE